MKKRILVFFLSLAMLVIPILPVRASDTATATHMDGAYGFRSVLSKNSIDSVFGCYGEFTSYPSGLSPNSMGATLYLQVDSLPVKYGEFDYPTTYGSIMKGTGGGSATSVYMEVNFYYPLGIYTSEIIWEWDEGFRIIR